MMDKEFIFNLSILIAYVVIYILLFTIRTAYYEYQTYAIYLLSGLLAGYSLRNISRYHTDKKGKEQKKK